MYALRSKEDKMAVGFKVDYYWYQVGTSDFLHAFFSTICFRLENGKWGSVYPKLMKELYQGRLKNQDINEGMEELGRIKKERKKFPPSYVVWDAEDLKLTPPWGNNISSDITDLSNYFVTNDGRDLISVLNEAMEDAKEIHSDIEIDKL